MQAASSHRSGTSAPPKAGVLNSRSYKLFKQGLRLDAAGQLGEAASAFEAVAACNPSHAETFRNLAILRGRAGRLGGAIEAWQQVLLLRPAEATSYTNLGKALTSAGRLDCAIAVFTKGCGLHAGDADLLALNASALLRAGRADLAIGALFLLLELRPESADTHRELSRAFHSIGKLEQALASCLEALQRAPDHVNLTDLSHILIKMRHYDHAIQVSEQVLGLKPDSFEAANNRVIALEALGRFDEAVAAWRHVVATAPDNPIARHNLAAALLSQGQLTAEAWELYEWRFMLKSTTAWMFTRPRWMGGKRRLMAALWG